MSSITMKLGVSCLIGLFAAAFTPAALAGERDDPTVSAATAETQGGWHTAKAMTDEELAEVDAGFTPVFPAFFFSSVNLNGQTWLRNFFLGTQVFGTKVQVGDSVRIKTINLNFDHSNHSNGMTQE